MTTEIRHLPTDLARWLHDTSAIDDEIFEPADWERWGRQALAEMRDFANRELTLECEAGNLLAALKNMVDRDLTYIDGCVMGGQISSREINAARFLIAEIEVRDQ